MTRIRVKGFKIFDYRHGKPRCYLRVTDHKIDLEMTALGSAEFFAECARIAAIAKASKAQAPKPGTLGGLVNACFQACFQTEHFRNLADATKRNYRRLSPMR